MNNLDLDVRTFTNECNVLWFQILEGHDLKKFVKQEKPEDSIDWGAHDMSLQTPDTKKSFVQSPSPSFGVADVAGAIYDAYDDAATSLTMMDTQIDPDTQTACVDDAPTDVVHDAYDDTQCYSHDAGAADPVEAERVILAARQDSQHEDGQRPWLDTDTPPIEAAPFMTDDVPIEAAPVTTDEVPFEVAPVRTDEVPTEAAPVTTDEVPVEAAPVTTDDVPSEAVPEVPIEAAPVETGEVPAEAIPTTSTTDEMIDDNNLKHIFDTCLTIDDSQQSVTTDAYGIIDETDGGKLNGDDCSEGPDGNLQNFFLKHAQQESDDKSGIDCRGTTEVALHVDKVHALFVVVAAVVAAVVVAVAVAVVAVAVAVAVAVSVAVAVAVPKGNRPGSSCRGGLT